MCKESSIKNELKEWAELMKLCDEVKEDKKGAKKSASNNKDKNQLSLF